MIGLVQKELKQLIPYALIWFSLMALSYGSELFSLRVDESSYAAWCGEVCDAGIFTDLVFFNILLFLIAAYSLFPREYDDSTVDFLRSLPVSRSRIFVAKIVAILLLLWLLILFDRVFQIAVLSLNTQSITGKAYWKTDLLFYVRDCLFAFVIVCHGVFLSWFRTIGLILYCTYLIVLIWLEQVLKVSGVYSVFGFYSNEYNGQNLLLDWATIGFHLVVAALLLFVSYFLWSNTDSKPRAPGSGKLAKIVPILFSVIAFFMVAGYMITMMGVGSDDSEQGIARVTSEHYMFSYRDTDEEAMQELLKYAEPDYEALVALLGAKNRPIIQADMTSESNHALGLASWKSIKMILTTKDEVNPLYRRVLSHETAHVFQSVESDRAFSESGNSVNFFIEGMAQFTSFQIVPDVDSRDSNWMISAVSWARHNIKFEEMANRQVFATLYDPEMLYGIGDIWVSALAQTCGVESIGNFLRAVGRDNAPPNLSGSLYWRSHLQHIGCELEEVNNHWRGMMQNIVDTRSIGAFPHFENVIVSRDEATDLISIIADLKAGELGVLPQNYYLRVQSEVKLANAISPVITGKLVRDGETARVEFSVLPRLIDGQKFRYQLGYMPLPDSRNFYEQWRSGSVP